MMNTKQRDVSRSAPIEAVFTLRLSTIRTTRAICAVGVLGVLMCCGRGPQSETVVGSAESSVVSAPRVKAKPSKEIRKQDARVQESTVVGDPALGSCAPPVVLGGDQHGAVSSSSPSPHVFPVVLLGKARVPLGHAQALIITSRPLRDAFANWMAMAVAVKDESDASRYRAWAQDLLQLSARGLDGLNRSSYVGPLQAASDGTVEIPVTNTGDLLVAWTGSWPNIESVGYLYLNDPSAKDEQACVLFKSRSMLVRVVDPDGVAVPFAPIFAYAREDSGWWTCGSLDVGRKGELQLFGFLPVLMGISGPRALGFSSVGTEPRTVDESHLGRDGLLTLDLHVAESFSALVRIGGFEDWVWRGTGARVSADWQLNSEQRWTEVLQKDLLSDEMWFGALPVGGRIRFELFIAPGVPSTRVIVDARVENRDEVEVVLIPDPSLITVSGQLTDCSGQVLAGRRVAFRAVQSDRSVVRLGEWITDDLGEFEVPIPRFFEGHGGVCQLYLQLVGEPETTGRFKWDGGEEDLGPLQLSAQ